MEWFQDKTRIEYNSPIASHLRAHSAPTTRRTRVSNPVHGIGWTVGETERFDLGTLQHVVFDRLDNLGKHIEGAFRSDFLTAVSQ